MLPYPGATTSEGHHCLYAANCCAQCGRERPDSVLVKGDADAFEHPGRQREREADDVRVVAPDPLDKSCRPALDGVAAGLPHAVALTRVRREVLVAVRLHPDARDGVAHVQLATADNGDPRVD